VATDLTIVIVNWNTRAQLRACLSSLPTATTGLAVTTVVVDNDSHDGSAEMVRQEFPTCELVATGSNLGFSRANNLALAQVDSDLILLLNPDTVCPPHSLTALCDFLRSTPGAGAAGPTLLDAAGVPTASYGDFPAVRHHLAALLDPLGVWLPRRWREAGFGRIPRRGTSAGLVDYVKGACLLMTRAALREVGPLDERFFMYFEESDWCRRAQAAGFTVHHTGTSEIVHLEGGAAEQVNPFSLAQFQASYRHFVAKHYGPRWVWQFRAAQFAEYLGKGCLRWLAPGNRPSNRARARRHFALARLQLKPRLQPRPPE